ncbi:MAG: sulfatase [Deltaproteobacteria bacterium]|nr:sulfatase [Deltaproteobacteria bacterium]
MTTPAATPPTVVDTGLATFVGPANVDRGIRQWMSRRPKDPNDREVLLAGAILMLCTSCSGCKDEVEQLRETGEDGESPIQRRADADHVPQPAGTDAGPSTPPPTGSRVILVVVDTLRADRLGCYGFTDQPTSPTIDRLASEGILFERFHSASPWTAASFGSILTGVAPTVHRAGHRARKGAASTKSFLGVTTTPLSPRTPTIAELLGDTRSGAILTNSFLHPSMGFSRGFDHYDHQNAGLLRSRRADATTRAAAKWLQENHRDPFLLLVHYFDPHMSYDPPAAYRAQFAPGPSGRISVPFADHTRARNGELDPTETEKSFIRGLYNAEVRFVDDQIGVLVEAANRLGLLDDAWVVITSDHGEEQFEHGSFDHGHRYEDEVTRVPLVIRPPGGRWRAGSRIPYSARHIDIAPTILEWFGKARPARMSGRSLMPFIAGVEADHRAAYMEFNIYRGERRALYDGRYKLIWRIFNSTGQMYDLLQDPFERNPLDAAHPEFVRMTNELGATRQRIEKWASATRDESEDRVLLPAEVIESLRSLGYVE